MFNAFCITIKCIFCMELVCMVYIGICIQCWSRKLTCKYLLISFWFSWMNYILTLILPPSFFGPENVCFLPLLHTLKSTSSKIFNSPESKALGELIGWDSSRRPCVCPFTLSDMNISETSWPIIIKFHLKHHWGGGLTPLDFGPDRIRTLVSMATDSFHRVIMGKFLWAL